MNINIIDVYSIHIPKNKMSSCSLRDPAVFCALLRHIRYKSTTTCSVIEQVRARPWPQWPQWSGGLVYFSVYIYIAIYTYIYN